LPICLKAAIIFHHVVKRDFTAMPEGRVSNVVSQADRFDQAQTWYPLLEFLAGRVMRFVAQPFADAGADLCDFERMS